MKKTTTLIALLAILFSGFNAVAEGEDDDDRRRRGGGNFGVHLNLPPMAFGVFSGNVEYGFAKNMSAVMSLGGIYRSFKSELTTPNGTIENGYTYTGFMAAPEFRYYVKPNRRPGLDKFFIGGYLKVRSMSTGDSAFASVRVTQDPNDPFNITTEEFNYGISYFGLSAGVNFGYVYAMKSGLTFSGWLGFGYFIVNNVKYTVEDIDAEFSDFLSIDPRLGITVGYRF